MCLPDVVIIRLQSNNSFIVVDEVWEEHTTADWMVLQLVHIEGDVGHSMHHPLAVGTLLSGPLQDIRVSDCLQELVKVFCTTDQFGLCEDSSVVLAWVVVSQLTWNIYIYQ